jgi:hypothetical protein
MRIYRFISSFSEEETTIGLDKFEKETKDFLIDFANRYDFFDLRYDGKVCHWRDGDLYLSVGFCPEEYAIEFKKWDAIIHEGMDGFTKVEDITDEVLYGKHDMEIYGFLKENMIITFDDYIENYITKDIILDKINLYGIESLSENDKRILNDEPYIRYVDTLIDEDNDC